MEYVIGSGDTLYKIAGRYGTTVNTLLRLNPGLDPGRLRVGQKIIVPPVVVVGPSGCLVYVSTRTGQPELWRSDANGRGIVQLTRKSGTVAQPVANPRWSPDGKRVAYQAVGGLFVIDPCGRTPVRVAGRVTEYSWSNDSSRIAFSNPEGTFVTDLRGNSRLVNRQLVNPVWFPGDRKLAGSVPEIEEIRYSRLATVAISGADFTIIDRVPARTVKLSPNGRYAAAWLFKGYGYGVFGTIVIYDFTTGKSVNLPGFELQKQPATTSYVYNVSFLGGWAPDSSRFVYSTIMRQNGQGEVRIANPQGTVLQKFPRAYYPVAEWGPKADWIVYSSSANPGTTPFNITSTRDIFIRNLRTQQEIQIAGPGDAYAPNWSGVACPPC